MSKYTEVSTHLKENICKNCCTWNKSLRNCATCKVSVELESLEIADRLEQIIKNGTNRITEVLCKDCREKELLEALGGCQGICRAMSNVIGGYELALTDIRGNTE